MAVKSRFLALLNGCVLSPWTFFTSPLISYIVPYQYIWHGYWFTLCCNFCVYVMDVWNSDCTRKNFAIMKQAGLTPLEIWVSAAGTFFGFQIPNILLLIYGMEYNPDWNWPWPLLQHFGPYQLGLALAIVLSTDLVFYTMHRLLHRYFPRIHVLHHACVYTSQTTNLFFNPLDLAFEFTAPVLMMYVLCWFVLNDAWMFALCAAITQCYYASRHDEFLGGHHIAHHRGCGTNYFVYIHYFSSDAKLEQVRKYIQPFQKLE
ncbi:hypothetical protein ACA910_011956 [Epithemia clementina (nom. ined.)]